MTIKSVNLNFKNTLSVRKTTTAIILHHAAASKCSVQDVHSWHLSNGWAGIGYHFFVRKDGSIWQGRPIDKLGAHAKDANSYSIGICFEGDFTKETMPTAQLNAGKELVSYIRGKYPSITRILKHKDVCATTCPGGKFPFTEISKGKTQSSTDSTSTTNGVLTAKSAAGVYASPTKTATKSATMAVGAFYNYTSIYTGGDKVKWYLVKVGNATGWVCESDIILGKATISTGTTTAINKVKVVNIELTQIDKGATGNQVKTVQRILKELGYKGQDGKIVSVDGSYGNNTVYAIKTFQKNNSLTQDGSCGLNTWSKLLKG